MPDQQHHTTTENISQGSGGQDEWSQQIIPRLPAHLQEQAMKLKAFERSRKIVCATDLLRGLLAYVYIAHSFAHLSIWSVVLGVADVSANDWRRPLAKGEPRARLALTSRVHAIRSAISPWLLRAGARRILLIDGTHWKCLGPEARCLAGAYGFRFGGRSADPDQSDRLPRGRATGASLSCTKEMWWSTSRANGLRKRIAFVLSKGADIVVRISPSKFPMQDEHGASISVVEWGVWTPWRRRRGL
jgi:hypothetical protein